MPQTNHASLQVDPQRFRDCAMAELDALYRFALHLSREANEAEELVQETYLQAMRASGTFNHNYDSMRPWLFKIMHNGYRARHRRLALESRKLAELQAQASEDAPAWTGTDADGDDRIDWDRVDDRLKHAIHDLPDDLRATFLLFAAEQLKYRQIADVQDIPLGTVMSRLSRARKKLIETLSAGPTDANKIAVSRIVNRDETGSVKP